MTDPAAVFAVIANHLWQSALLAGVLAVALTFGRGLSASTRHMLAFATLTACAVLPLAALLPGGGLDRFAASVQAAPHPAARSAPTFIEPRAQAAAGSKRVSSAQVNVGSASVAFSPPPAKLRYDAAPAAPREEEAAPARGRSFRDTLVAARPALAIGLAVLWIGGVAVLLVRVGVDVLAAERLRLRAAPRALPDLLPARLRRLRVRESREVPGPLVVGVLAPTVLLPPGAIDRYTNHELRALLEHERAHIERGDVILALLERIFVALLWWSPAVRWIARRIDDEREMACDEAAAARMGDARAFAKTLAAHAHAHLFGPRLAVGATGGRSQLGRRLRRLIERAGGSAGSTRTARVAACVLAAAVAAAALATPRLSAQSADEDAPAASRAPNAAEARRAAADVAAAARDLQQARNRLASEVAAARRSGADNDDEIDALEDEIDEAADALAEAIEQVVTAATDVDVTFDFDGRRLEARGGVDLRGVAEAVRAAQASAAAGAAMGEAWGDWGEAFAENWEQEWEQSWNDAWNGDGFRYRYRTGRRDGGPLAAAIYSGDEDMVRVLVEAGADVNGAEGAEGAPLMAAIYSDDEDIVALLLEAGAEPGADHLVAAIYQGDADLVSALIEAGADVNGAGLGDQSPLVAAIYSGDSDIIEALLAAGANAETVRNGQSALVAAIYAGEDDLVRQLVEAGADVNAAGPGGVSPLAAAMYSGDTDLVRLLLDAGADVNSVNQSRNRVFARGRAVYGRRSYAEPDTPLLAAILDDDEDLARELIESGVDLDEPDGDGNTPLLTTIRQGQDDLARDLLEAGADVEAADENGYTPLLTAIRNGEDDVARALLEAGADVNATDSDGYTPLLTAIRRGEDDLARDLMEAGADVNATDGDGYTPLLTAIRRGEDDFARDLMEAGADVNATDEDGYTPLLIAIRRGEDDVARDLIAAGADVDAADEDGYTPLLTAIRHGQDDVARAIVEAGADVNAADEDGATPLMVAIQHGDTDLARALLDAGAELGE